MLYSCCVFVIVCGKTDTQAQIPTNQIEPSMTESASQSDPAERLGNLDVISGNAVSDATVSETMPKNAVSDETENMTKLGRYGRSRKCIRNGIG